MRGFRLSGWQRIGIVLSVVWLLVGNLWVHHILSERDEAYQTCLAAMTGRLFHCEPLQQIKRDTLFFTYVPVPLAWLLVYIIVSTVRWIRRRGFQPRSGWGQIP